MTSMRVNSAVLVGALCVFAFAAEAEIARLSPQSFTPSGEDYITVFGTNLTGSVATFVVFDGAIEIEPQLTSADQLFVWVPVEVLLVEGQHCLTVRSVDLNGVRTHGPACFTVALPDSGGDGPPLLSLPEFVGAEATSPAGASVTFEAFATDGDGPVTLMCSRPSGSTFPLGGTTVNCSATNSFGTSAGSFYVYVGDTTPPVLTLPADIAATDPVVTFTASAVDNIDGALSVSCTPASGATFAPGTTRVQCTAVDSRFNTAYGSFLVTVPGGAPVITTPLDIVEEATSAAGAAVTFEVTSNDGTPVICSPASGATFALGTTTVNCTAGVATASFKVTIVDTTPPAITAPSQVTAEATSPGGAEVVYVVTAADLVDGDIVPNCAPPSGSLFALGETFVTCFAADTRNNADSIAFPVTVVDTTPPVITVITASPAALWPPNHKMIDVTITASSVDAVDATPSVKIVSVSSNQPENGTGDGDTGPDWKITGPLTVQLRAEMAGTSKAERIYTITLETQDSAGNTGNATVTVRVADTKRRATRT